MTDTKRAVTTDIHTETITAGNSTTFAFEPGIVTSTTPPEGHRRIIVEPVSGGTITVEISISDVADILAETAIWHTDYTGTDSYASIAEQDSGVTGIRVTAATQNCSVAIRQ